MMKNTKAHMAVVHITMANQRSIQPVQGLSGVKTDGEEKTGVRRRYVHVCVCEGTNV